MRLGLTLPLRPAQTETSLVSNLAALNGSQYVQDFALDMGLNWNGLAKGLPEEISLLSDLAGVSLERFDRFKSVFVCDHEDRKSYTIAGQTVSNRQFLRGRLRVCPQCLMEDWDAHGQFGPYTRIYWHISSIRTCVWHDQGLLELPDAEFPRNAHDTFARIRDHWTLIEKTAAQGVPRKPSAFERYLVGRLDGIVAGNISDDSPFDVVAKTAEMLGHAIAFGPNVSFTKSTEEELAKAGAVGFNAFNKGRNEINAALKGIQDSSSGVRSGHYTDFGHFARWLDRMSYDNRYEPMRTIFREYVFRSYPIGRGEVILGGECPKRRLHSFATISKKFPMNPNRMKSFLIGFGFCDGIPTGRPRPEDFGYFNAEESEARIREVIDAIDRVEAGKYMNVNLPLFDRLRKIGVLHPVATFDGLKGLYKPEHLDQVLGMFLDQSEPIDAFAGSRMSLGTACNKAKLTMEQVIPRILDGSIKWLGCVREIEGLSALAVDLEEILDLFEGPPLKGYTKQQLRRMLRVNDPTITYLVKERYLRAYETRHPRSRRPMSIVPAEEYDAFLERYTTLGILANNIGTQAKHVSAKLDKMKIAPIQLPERFSIVYEREKLKGVIDGDYWASELSGQVEG